MPVKIEVEFPEEMVRKMDILINLGMYPNRKEIIRTAVRDYIKNYEKRKKYEQKNKSVYDKILERRIGTVRMPI